MLEEQQLEVTSLLSKAIFKERYIYFEHDKDQLRH